MADLNIPMSPNDISERRSVQVRCAICGRLSDEADAFAEYQGASIRLLSLPSGWTVNAQGKPVHTTADHV
jgi:hypothetical protein